MMLIVIEQCYINDKKKRLMNFKKNKNLLHISSGKEFKNRNNEWLSDPWVTSGDMI